MSAAKSRSTGQRGKPLLGSQAGDALLTAREAGALAGGISEQHWTRYATRWPALRKGMRIVRVSGARSRGRARWLMSAVIKHITEELLRPELDATYANSTHTSTTPSRPCSEKARERGAAL